VESMYEPTQGKKGGRQTGKAYSVNGRGTSISKNRSNSPTGYTLTRVGGTAYKNAGKTGKLPTG